MNTQIDVQCGIDMGCRICHKQADVAYILCPEHQRFSRVAPDLLSALKRARDQAQGVANSLREWPRGDPHIPFKEIPITFGRLLEIKYCLVSLNDAVRVANDAIKNAEKKEEPYLGGTKIYPSC